jgi:hypothetical protein
MTCVRCGREFGVAFQCQVRRRKYCSQACRRSKPADFWSQVEKAESCWLWRGRTNRDGYGEFSHDGDRSMAHRYAWEQMGLVIPAGGILLHTCDVPACVNPAHLRVGTHQDNQVDKVQKGRQAKGEASGAAILTSEDVREIRQAYRRQSRPGASDGNVGDLSQRYGVTRGAIWSVVQRRVWSHVE